MAYFLWMHWRRSLTMAVALGCLSTSMGAIVGTNPPARPLTFHRIADLSAGARPAWEAYWNHSLSLRSNYYQMLLSELRNHDLRTTTPPNVGSLNARQLKGSEAWFQTAEARHAAENLVSFQTPMGGWGKNLDFTSHRRATGQQFTEHAPIQIDETVDIKKLRISFAATFDNGATVSQLRFLARVIAAQESLHVQPMIDAFIRGLGYVMAAQYPNGGWPQVYPLEGAYHDAITYNDGAMAGILDLLREVTESGAFKFVPEPRRHAAAAALHRGLQCVIKTQVLVEGRRTGWSQQYDPLTLEPAPARNYEMPALSPPESSGMMLVLMRLRQPSDEIVFAVHQAASWLKKTSMHDVSFISAGASGRLLVATTNTGALWPRYCEIGTDRPLFGDRDRTIHDDVSEISRERRDGYSWFSKQPADALSVYATWQLSHPKATAPR